MTPRKPIAAAQWWHQAEGMNGEGLREDAADAIRQYGRECANAVESFRCAEPDLGAAMQPFDTLAARLAASEAIAEAARGFVTARTDIAAAYAALVAAVDAQCEARP